MIAVTVYHRIQVALPPVIEGDMIIANIFSVTPTIECFVNDQHSQSVASLEEGGGRWVVRTTNGIEPACLEQLNLARFRTRVGSRPQNSVIVMHTASLQQSRNAVEQEPFLGTEFDTADSKRGAFGVGNFSIDDDVNFKLIQMRGIK